MAQKTRQIIYLFFGGVDQMKRIRKHLKRGLSVLLCTTLLMCSVQLQAFAEVVNGSSYDSSQEAGHEAGYEDNISDDTAGTGGEELTGEEVSDVTSGEESQEAGSGEESQEAGSGEESQEAGSGEESQEAGSGEVSQETGSDEISSDTGDRKSVV